MRSLLGSVIIAVLLCGIAVPRAHADDANLKITVTNGTDTHGEARILVRPSGQHGGNVVTSGGSADDIKVAAGTYDVEIRFRDGSAEKIVWLDSLAISGRVEKTVDIGMPMATLHVAITNGGTDVAGNGLFEVRPAGQHGANVIASGSSGDTVRLAAGTYDVDVRFHDGAASKMIWLDGVALSGAVEKTVEVGMPMATLHVAITNGGTDVAGNGLFEVRPAGQHGANVIASGSSGDTVRLAAGAYDVDVRFRDGAVSKMTWLDGVALSGAVEKTVEVGTAMATLHVAITNGGDRRRRKRPVRGAPGRAARRQRHRLRQLR